MDIQVSGILGLIWLVVVIWAIIQVAQSSASGTEKLVWILVMLFLPVIGVIIWFFIGPKSGRIT
ncbi:MAG: PLDc N-terminal domain-containing protein [Pseudohongiellaceae bacterium]